MPGLINRVLSALLELAAWLVTGCGFGAAILLALAWGVAPVLIWAAVLILIIRAFN